MTEVAVEIDVAITLLSGIPLAVVGLLLSGIRPIQRHQAFFSLFAVAWGAQIVVTNLGRALGLAPGPYRSALLLGYGLSAVAVLFLARYVALHLDDRLAMVVTASFVAVVSLAVVVLVAAPAWVVAAVPGPGGGSVALGPAVLPLFTGPFYGLFYLTVVLLYRRYRGAEPGSDRHRVRSLLIAFALFPAYASTRNLLAFLGASPTSLPAGVLGLPGFLALFGLGTAVLVGVAAHALWRPADPGGRDALLVAACTVPVGTALLEAGLAGLGVAVETLGVWRLLSVVAIVYAVARYRLFDLDLRIRRTTGTGTAALALGAGAVLAAWWWSSGASQTVALAPLAVGAVGAGAAWTRRDGLAEWLFPGVEDEASYRRQRKLEVYRTSLQETLDRDAELDDPELARERRRLGISDREHEVMAYLLTKEDPDETPSSSARIEPGATLADRYRIERLIGEGAHGRVFEAWDTVEERRVAAKVVGRALFAGRAAKRLLEEARTIADLDHPNVLDVHDVLERDREVVMVTGYADGGDLADLIERRGALGTRRALELVDGVLAGLSAAHGAGVVHRDLKPENVLLVDGRPVVADFGVARRSDREETDLAGEAVGTLLYTSPEQVRGDDVDARSDVYAAGVLLHLLATGRHVMGVAGRDDFQLRRAILEEPPDLALDDAPARVREAVRTALSKDPADRFATAEAMRAALAGD